MKLQIKTTFDFGKLARQMTKILEKHTHRTARSSATGAREAIDKGVLISPIDAMGFDMGGELKGLNDSTIAIRKKRGTGGTKPLYETGALYRSIKGTSEGLQMFKYGIYQHRGFTTGGNSMIPNKRVRPSPFIQVSEKAILKSFDAFRKDLRKALKK